MEFLLLSVIQDYPGGENIAILSYSYTTLVHMPIVRVIHV